MAWRAIFHPIVLVMYKFKIFEVLVLRFISRYGNIKVDVLINRIFTLLEEPLNNCSY
jgi:hypothetical protein